MFGSCKWNMRLLEGIEGVSICHAQSGEVFGKKKMQMVLLYISYIRQAPDDDDSIGFKNYPLNCF